MKTRIILLSFALLLPRFVEVRGQILYELIDMSGTNLHGAAYSINNSGQTVGWAGFGGNRQAALYDSTGK